MKQTGQNLYSKSNQKMITLPDAYKKVKKSTDRPICYISESDEYYWGSCKMIINKKTGGFENISTWNLYDFLDLVHQSHDIFYMKMFTDYMVYYRKNRSEKILADMYAEAWYRLYTYNKPITDATPPDDDTALLISEWSLIEAQLYKDIRLIMDNDNTIVYPPCVLNKFDDPFYRIKPFMLRNGWTDDKTSREWVTVDN